MYELGKVFTSKFVGTGPSSYKKRIYRATISQRLRNPGVGDLVYPRSRSRLDGDERSLLLPEIEARSSIP